MRLFRCATNQWSNGKRTRLLWSSSIVTSIDRYWRGGGHFKGDLRVPPENSRAPLSPGEGLSPATTLVVHKYSNHDDEVLNCERIADETIHPFVNIDNEYYTQSGETSNFYNPWKCCVHGAARASAGNRFAVYLKRVWYQKESGSIKTLYSLRIDDITGRWVASWKFQIENVVCLRGLYEPPARMLD